MSTPTTERKVSTTVPEAAKYLGIGRGYAYQLAHTGELPGVRKIGNRFVVSVKELEAFMDGDAA